MKNDNTLRYEVTAQPGSDLEKAVNTYLKDRNERRAKAQQEYNNLVEKQKKRMNEAGYNFIEKSPGIFEFYTNYGAAYKIEFIEAAVYFNSVNPVSQFIYSIDIILLYPGAYNFYDYIISITVAEIILYFIDRDNRIVIFYICDSSDGKMIARQRKFEYWFNLYNTSEYKKITSIFTSRQVSMIANFIFLKNNPFAYDIPLMIDEAKDSFNNK